MVFFSLGRQKPSILVHLFLSLQLTFHSSTIFLRCWMPYIFCFCMTWCCTIWKSRFVRLFLFHSVSPYKDNFPVKATCFKCPYIMLPCTHVPIRCPMIVVCYLDGKLMYVSCLEHYYQLIVQLAINQEGIIAIHIYQIKYCVIKFVHIVNRSLMTNLTNNSRSLS